MSDIGSGSVSWRNGNEPKDKAVLRGEPFRKYAIEAILLDLIAELRERFDDESMPTFDDWTHMRRGVLADAKTAEVRLREVQGE